MVEYLQAEQMEASSNPSIVTAANIFLADNVTETNELSLFEASDSMVDFPLFIEANHLFIQTYVTRLKNSGESRNFSGHLLQSNSKRNPPLFYLFMDSKGSKQLPHEVSNFLQQQLQSMGDIKAAETQDSQIVIADKEGKKQQLTAGPQREVLRRTGIGKLKGGVEG
ncbi:hypothetical protein V6N11_040464 [Hibiscus sabdariffa]|uniref:Uncharacterized protein n=1 Tax=Hibiscus sabdariffa TaxID=183260 RepID=A0ABR2RHV8_9ROSI